MVLLTIILAGMPSLLLSQVEEVNRGYEKGKVKGRYKIGVWEYYDSTGTLELGVDYSTQSLTFLKRDTTEYVINKDGQWIKSRLDIPPRFIGSYVDFYKILNEHVDYPMQAWYRDVVGDVIISFEIDTMGKATNYQTIKDIGGECAWEFTRVLKVVPNYWLVAEKDGQKYASRFIIRCNYRIIMDGRPLKEKIRKGKRHNKDTSQIPLARELPGISHTVKKGYNPED